MTSVLLRIATQRSNSHTFVYTRLKKRWAPTSHVLLLVDQWHQSAGAACPVWTRTRADDRYRHLLPSSRCTRNNFAALGLFLHAAICMRKHNECFVLAVGRQSWSSKVDVWQSFPEAMSALKKKRVSLSYMWNQHALTMRPWRGKKKKEKEEGKNNNKMLFLKKVFFFQI